MFQLRTKIWSVGVHETDLTDKPANIVSNVCKISILAIYTVVQWTKHEMVIEVWSVFIHNRITGHRGLGVC